MSAILEDSTRTLQTVQAVLNYTRKTGVRPVNYTFDPPPGVPRNSGVVDERSVTIYNARLARALTLESNGFELVEHHSALGHWETFQNRELVETIDYPEVSAALRRHTGAERPVGV